MDGAAGCPPPRGVGRVGRSRTRHGRRKQMSQALHCYKHSAPARRRSPRGVGRVEAKPDPPRPDPAVFRRDTPAAIPPYIVKPLRGSRRGGRKAACINLPSPTSCSVRRSCSGSPLRTAGTRMLRLAGRRPPQGDAAPRPPAPGAPGAPPDEASTRERLSGQLSAGRGPSPSAGPRASGAARPWRAPPARREPGKAPSCPGPGEPSRGHGSVSSP